MSTATNDRGEQDSVAPDGLDPFEMARDALVEGATAPAELQAFHTNPAMEPPGTYRLWRRLRVRDGFEWNDVCTAAGLAGALDRLAAGSHCLQDYEIAAEAWDCALDHFEQDNHPDISLSWIFGSVGDSHMCVYENGGDIGRLDDAIRSYRGALEEARPGRGLQKIACNNLAISLIYRFYEKGAAADANHAIHYFRQVVNLTGPDDDDRAGRLTNLGNALNSRFFHLGVVEDLHESIGALEAAVEAGGATAPNHAIMLGNLGSGIHRRYQVDGAATDLERALEFLRAATKAMPPSHFDRPRILENYANVLRDRYDLRGDIEDLNAAIELLREGLSLLADHAQAKAGILNDLGTSLVTRFAHTGTRACLDAGIEHLQASLERSPPDSAELPARLNNLGLALKARHVATQKEEALDAAIEHLKAAVAGTPRTDTFYAGYLNNLGNSLVARFKQKGKPEDLAAGVRQLRAAVGRTPHDSPERSGRINNLGGALEDRFRAFGRRSDLDGAIACYRRALGTAVRVSDRPSVQYNLACALDLRGERFGAQADWADAKRHAEAALSVAEEVRPRQAAHLGHHWGHALFARGEWAAAAQFYGRADRALAAAWVGQALRSDKGKALEGLESLAANWSYALARSGAVDCAVVAAEAARARLMRDAQSRRVRDLDELAQGVHAPLVDAYRRCAKRVAELDYLAAHHGAMAVDAQHQVASRRDLDAAIDAIRRLDGFQGFLRGTTMEDIRALAVAAPVVYIGATLHGGHALITRAEGDPAVVWLPELTTTALAQRLDDYLAAHQEAYEGQPGKWFQQLPLTLDWLAEVCTAPVLQALAGEAELVLVPLGSLGVLPLAAAGLHTAGPGMPTIRLAASACSLGTVHRAMARRKWGILGEALIVAAPAGSSPSEAMIWEAEEVRRHLKPGSGVILTGPRATRAAVLERLAGPDLIHLAVHGVARPDAPLDSCLHLVDRAEITVGDMMQARLRARLVVLSACESSIPGFANVDELESLPAGVLEAGAAAVIATLWSVNDYATFLFMSRFYDGWLHEGLTPAHALHKAQDWLRTASRAECMAQVRRTVQGSLGGTRGESSVSAEQAFAHLPDAWFEELAHPHYWAAFTYTGV